MCRVYFFVLCLFSTVCFPVAAAEPQNKTETKPAVTNNDPRESLDTTLAEAIRLLESKEYKKLLTDLMSPQDKKIFGQEFEKMIPQFAEVAHYNVRLLKAAQNVKPEMDKENAVASFKLVKLEGGVSGTLIFVKNDNLWYWNFNDSNFFVPKRAD